MGVFFYQNDLISFENSEFVKICCEQLKSKSNMIKYRHDFQIDKHVDLYLRIVSNMVQENIY